MNAKIILPVILVIISLGILLYFAVAHYDLNTIKIPDPKQEYDVYSHIVNGHPYSFQTKDNLLVSCLTTTYLPAMIQKITHLNPVTLFRYYAIPLMMWLPLIVYFIAAKYLSLYHSFLVGIAFAAQPFYTIAPMAARIVLGNTFLALGILVLLSNITNKRKVLYLIPISVMMVITHYGTTFVAIAFLALWLITSLIHSRLKWKPTISLIPIAVFLGLLIFGVVIWYGVLTNTALSYAGGVIHNSLIDMVVPTAQDSMTKVALGMTFFTMNVPQKIEFVLTWMLIVTAGIGLLLNLKNKSLSIPTMVGFGLMTLCVLVPTIGRTNGIERIYFFFSALILICMVMGLNKLSYMLKIRTWILPTTLCGLYFITASGITYSLFGYSRFA